MLLEYIIWNIIQTSNYMTQNIVEMDCLALAQKLQISKEDFSYVRNIIADILSLRSQFHSICSSYVRQTTNSTIYFLAQLAFFFSVCTVVTDDFPSSLTEIVQAEASAL